MKHLNLIENVKKIFMFNRYLYLCLLLYVGISVFPSISYSSSLQISPIRVQLLPGQKTTSMNINNNSGNPVVVQLSVVKWDYHNGQDVYTHTKDIIATPPIATIQPQEKQIVRLGVIAPPKAQKGETYRLIIKEVPVSTFEPLMGIHTLLEIRMPIVVAPFTPSKPQIVWTANRVGEKKLNVKWENTGESYVSFVTLVYFLKTKKNH
jgi:fimbrial chaperone protein